MKISRALSFAIVFMCGCWSAGGTVRTRHAAEFGCPARDVLVEDLGSGTVRATGCGVTAMYVCAGLCTRDSQPTRVGQTSGGALPSRPQWSDDDVRAFVAAANDGVVRCTNGAAIELGMTIGSDGRPSDLTGEVGGAEQQSCIAAALAVTPPLSGGGAPRRVHARFALRLATTAPPQVPAPDPFPDAVRVQITEHATAVLACAGGASAAVEARWSSNGVVMFALRGEPDPQISGCVQAAVGSIPVPTGTTPGQLLHPVAR
jgi:hypothetical protein